MSVLEIKSLAVGYGADKIVEGINFSLEPGQFISLVAPNGAGKSTFLKTVAGVLPLINGEIMLAGKPLAAYSRRELARKIAVVSSAAIVPDYTVQEFVTMGRFPFLKRFKGLSANDKELVQAALEDVGIWEKRSFLLRRLSQGEQQKAVIAQALAQQPELLLLDEPTAHLDVYNQVAVLRLIAEIMRLRQMAVIAVIHDLNQAANFASHLLLFKNGRTLAFGETKKVFSVETLKQLYGLDFTIHSSDAELYAMYSMKNLAGDCF